VTDTPLTQRQKDGLRARGFTDEAMLDIPPEEADQIIRNITLERAQEILDGGGTAPEPDHAQPTNTWDASFAPETDVPPEPEQEGVPFVLTHAIKEALRAHGMSADEIDNITPTQAHEFLKSNGGWPPEADKEPPPEPNHDEAEQAPPDQFDWAAHTEAVVADIFDEPNAEMSRPPEDVRYGNHGSVSINFTTGIWYDHENERGGGIKELIRVYKGGRQPRRGNRLRRAVSAEF
jgi:hypothetical protein